MTTVRILAGPAANCTHIEYQAAIVELAGFLHWHHLSVRRTIGRGHKWVTATNLIGWPDLFLFHDDYGFAAIEVKVGRDKPTGEQQAVLAELAAAGARVLVAYPADWPAVVALLSGTSQ